MDTCLQALRQAERTDIGFSESIEEEDQVVVTNAVKEWSCGVVTKCSSRSISAP